MSQHDGLDRRAFLRNTGMTALLGAVGAGGASAAADAVASAAFEAPSNGKYDFDTPYNRVGTDCIKWDQPARVFGRENVQVGMGIADMDFKAAPCIAQALAQRCQHENWGYMDTPANYIDAIVAWNKRRYGLEIDPKSVTLTTGVHPGLIAAMRALSPKGSKVLLTSPVYNGFYGDLRFLGLLPEDSPMKLVDGRYSIDFDDFERRISHETNVFILCNPQNPTGNVWSPEDLTRLGEICLRRRVVILADEIHCDFVTKGVKYTPFATLPNKDIVHNSITFKAASKSFSLAAMKAAWCFSTNPELVEMVRSNNRADLSTLGMIANRAAMNEGQDWLDQLLPYIDANHEFTASFVKSNLSPLIKCVKPQGTYLSWLDVSELADKVGAKEKAAEEARKTGKPFTPEQYMQRWFIYNAKVDLNPGSTYGTGGQGHMRMNIATARKTLELALNNLAGAIKKTATA